MTTTSPLPPLARSIGVTERALRTLLDIRLAQAELSFAQWAVLNVLQVSGSLTVDQLVRQQLDTFAAATTSEAEDAVGDLRRRGLTAHQQPDDPQSPVTLTEAGRARFLPMLVESQTVTRELWGDLPAADLEATDRTLGEIGRRAHLRLADLVP